jgi:proline dehydrogenase
MSLGRNMLLWASRNEWLKTRVAKMQFVQSAVKRFMPGESEEDAITAAKELLKYKIPTTLTHLGENIISLKEAEDNTNHYLSLLDKISNKKIDIEISLKLTQIGFNLSFDKTLEFFTEIALKAREFNNNIFIDIEDSSYTNKTINFYKKIKENYNNVGLCLQAYLYRTMDDLKDIMDINPWIRLVKGAYKEPTTVAFQKLSDVNKNYIALSEYLLRQIKERGIRVAIGTHDLIIQEQVKKEAEQIGISKDKYEFQMLYGIKTNEQYKLASQGHKIRTLISYGEHWYPWYMRRLAERPANIGFILKNLFNI